MFVVSPAEMTTRLPKRNILLFLLFIGCWVNGEDGMLRLVAKRGKRPGWWDEKNNDKKLKKRTEKKNLRWARSIMARFNFTIFNFDICFNPLEVTVHRNQMLCWSRPPEDVSRYLVSFLDSRRYAIQFRPTVLPIIDRMCIFRLL